MPSTYYVAWWNLENLFDEENSAAAHGQGGAGDQNDIAGWTPALRDRKVAQLASLIARMNDGAGPDLLGVCEVENRFVLDLLVDARRRDAARPPYEVVHADTVDARGIDVAFLYDGQLLEVPPPASVFFHVVMRRNATREIVQVNFRTHRGPHLGGVREPLAVAQRRRVRVGRLPADRRGDAGLLPSAVGGARRRHPGAGDGRLQRRTVRPLAGDARAEHPPAAKVSRRATPRGFGT